MDLSFSLQLESALHIYTGKLTKEPGIYPVPMETDRAVMESKLAALGIKIDTMTDEQTKYMKSWQE